MFEISKLNKLITNYCGNNKMADKEFVYDVVDIVSNSRKCGKYINNIEFSEEAFYAGEYNFLDRNIVVSSLKERKDSISATEYNFLILHILLHELEHACQLKLCYEENRNSIKSILLSEEIKFRIKSYNDMMNFIEKISIEKMNDLSTEKIKTLSNEALKKIQEENEKTEILNELYVYSPSERMAEIDSIKKMLQIIEKNKLPEVKNEYAKWLCGYNMRKLNGYRKENDGAIISPLKNYYVILDSLTNNSNEEKFDVIDKMYSGADLDTRLYFGLFINSKEYDNIHSKIKMIFK